MSQSFRGGGWKRRLGELLVDGEFISNADLDRALAEQQRTGELLGEILVRLGALTPTELTAVLKVQEHLTSLEDAVRLAAGSRQRLGALLLQSRRMTTQELEKALQAQQRTNAKLGQLLLDMGLLASGELQALLAFQEHQERPSGTFPTLRLGEILVATGEITREQLGEALERQRGTEKKLGELLVEAGYVRPEQVERGLNLQRRLITATLSAALALASLGGPGISPAAADPADRGRAHVTVSARVLPRVVLDVQEQIQELKLSPEDIERGYVEIQPASRVKVRTNSREGYLLNFDIAADYLKEVKVLGLAGDVALGSKGGQITQPYPGTAAVELELGYRIHLSERALPGTYPWPIRISAAVR